MTYDAKVFCGTFSRNGKHFVTASQGQWSSILYMLLVQLLQIHSLSFTVNLIFFLHFTIPDNMIRIHDSTTMRYKCQNEIIAKDVNWCILDIAFSPGSEYFVYSTWSSCCKCHSVFSRKINMILYFILDSINRDVFLFHLFSTFESNQWNITSAKTIVFTTI